jgi:hypothetical protein
VGGFAATVSSMKRKETSYQKMDWTGEKAIFVFVFHASVLQL